MSKTMLHRDMQAYAEEIVERGRKALTPVDDVRGGTGEDLRYRYFLRYMGISNLSGSNLEGADLTEVDLDGVRLRGVLLVGATLGDNSEEELRESGAVLRYEDAEPFRAGVLSVLRTYPNEAAGVAEALREGRVDGWFYEGECACLVGTIANLQGRHVDYLPQVPGSPAEVWFSGIRPGDTPENSVRVAWALRWVEEFLAEAGEAT